MPATTRAPYDSMQGRPARLGHGLKRTSTLRRLHAPTALVDDRGDWALVAGVAEGLFGLDEGEEDRFADAAAGEYLQHAVDA